LGIFIFPPEVLTFSNWALIHENLFFLLISPMDQLQMDLWTSTSFTKKSHCFQI
jgi:hypothetical protein